MDDQTTAFMRTWGTRDAAVAFPHDMNITAYLMRTLGVPRFALDGLAYHYTGASALMNIVKTNRFWATHWAFLNDPTERHFGLDVATQVLQSWRTKLPDSVLHRAFEKLATPPETDRYIVSFCRDGDLLSQWRGYGSFGAGYAIGFDVKNLRPHGQVGWLIEVSYDESELRRLIDDLISIYMEFLEVHPNAWDDVGDWLAGSVKFLSLAFKHPTFAEEQEIRLIYTRYTDIEKAPVYETKSGAPVSYRARESSIIPYLDIGLDFADAENCRDLPVVEVVMGPGVPGENRRSVEMYLRSVGHEEATVRVSSIPFRA